MADQFTLQHGGSDQFLEQWGIVPQPAIPFTTPDDNGKVLGVSEGQYALVSGGGGGGSSALIVTCSINGNGYLVMDKTWQEVTDADVVKITFELNEYTYFVYVTGFGIDNGAYEILAYAAFVDSEQVNFTPLIFTCSGADERPMAIVPNS